MTATDGSVPAEGAGGNELSDATGDADVITTTSASGGMAAEMETERVLTCGHNQSEAEIETLVAEGTDCETESGKVGSA